jgi:hypothetical protein
VEVPVAPLRATHRGNPRAFNAPKSSMEQDEVSDQASLEHCQFAQADQMKCKTDQIRTAWAAGDRIGALRIAARFFDRSADTLTFKRGMDAQNNPSFYRQLGKDPAQLVRSALEVLAGRFSQR